MKFYADKVDTADMGKLEGIFMASRDRDDYDYVFEDQDNKILCFGLLLSVYKALMSINKYKVELLVPIDENCRQ